MFREEVEAGRSAYATSDLATAAEVLTRALARWRGPALADVAALPWAAPMAQRLESLRREAEKILASLGQGPNQTSEVPRVVVQEPQPTPNLEPWPERDGIRSDGPLPDGVVTWLLTDIVGSTRLWEQAKESMPRAIRRHDALMKSSVEANNGMVIREKGQGDSTFSVFRKATDGAAAALASQAGLGAEAWPEDCVITVRMALHTGEAELRDRDYEGQAPNRVSRILDLAGPGQILVSNACAEIIADHLPPGAVLVPLGLHRLLDMDRPESIYLLTTTEALADADRDLEGLPDASGLAEPTGVASDESVDDPTWELVVAVDREYFDTFVTDHEWREVPDRRFGLTEPIVVIGRSSSSDIDFSGPFDDENMSRCHVLLERQPGGRYALIDQGSTNGTYVNSWMQPPIPKGVRTMLGDGDIVFIGNRTKLVLSRSGEPAPSGEG